MTPAFASWHDFWQMGGYAFYVWLSVGGTLLPLLALFAHTHWQRKSLWRQIARQQTRQRRRLAAQHKQEVA